MEVLMQNTPTHFSKFAGTDFSYQLEPINKAIDEMLVRLEELETMVTLVQKEHCGAISFIKGVTARLDYQKEFIQLCLRIDEFEKLVECVKQNIISLESNMEISEKKFALIPNSNNLKNIFYHYIYPGMENK